jgi:hypothetical protein
MAKKNLWPTKRKFALRKKHGALIEHWIKLRLTRFKAEDELFVVEKRVVST